MEDGLWAFQTAVARCASIPKRDRSGNQPQQIERTIPKQKGRWGSNGRIPTHHHTYDRCRNGRAPKPASHPIYATPTIRLPHPLRTGGRCRTKSEPATAVGKQAGDWQADVARWGHRPHHKNLEDHAPAGKERTLRRCMKRIATWVNYQKSTQNQRYGLVLIQINRHFHSLSLYLLPPQNKYHEYEVCFDLNMQKSIHHW